VLRLQLERKDGELTLVPLRINRQERLQELDTEHNDGRSSNERKGLAITLVTLRMPLTLIVMISASSVSGNERGMSGALSNVVDENGNIQPFDRLRKPPLVVVGSRAVHSQNLGLDAGVSSLDLGTGPGELAGGTRRNRCRTPSVRAAGQTLCRCRRRRL
jgi:hypothetical protein